MSASSNNTRYPFALEPPLSTPSAIQELLQSSSPPATVTDHDPSGSPTTFALLPLSALEPITKAIYPEPPSFNSVTLAAKAIPLPRLGIDTTLPHHRPHTAPTSSKPEKEFPVPYFFYRTLADPNVLKSKLHLDAEPELRTASIWRGRLVMWGPYRALVDGEAGDSVQGMVFEVRSEAQEDLLRFYETGAYEVVECEIEMGQGGALRGRTFRWAEGRGGGGFCVRVRGGVDRVCEDVS